METKDTLREINTWQKKLGLLPVPLFDNQPEARYILLNGTQGNFCLDIDDRNDLIVNNSRDIAWSSNVGHYVFLRGDRVEVQRWDQQSSVFERYSLQSVYTNLEKFHQYLEKSTPKQELSVIAHSIKTFRRIRAILGRSVGGGEGLKAFLYFLCCATEHKNRGEIDLTTWHLTSDVLDIVNLIRGGDWDALLEEYLGGRPFEGLSPDVSLILRHASGQLFQEAHFEAMFTNPQQLLLSGFLPDAVKVKDFNEKSIGLHFTPPALARTLVEESIRLIDLSSPRLTIFDPACGSGEFLREILRQLKLKNYTGSVQLTGWDISETACAMANFEVGWELRGINFPVEVNIDCRDSLLNPNEWPTNIDIIIMNPPFVSWQKMDSSLKAKVKTILSSNSGARPDLSHAFLFLASNSVKKDGAIGTIVPASVLDGISAQNIREYLGQRLQPALLARLGSHQLFPGAMIDAAFYVAKNGQLNIEPLSFWADFKANSNSTGLRALRRIRYYSTSQSLPVLEDGFTIYSLPDIKKKSDPWTPRPYGSWKLINSIHMGTAIKDIFDVRQGIRTGDKKVFILPREKLLELPESEQRYFRPSIVNESIRFGFIRLLHKTAHAAQ